MSIFTTQVQKITHKESNTKPNVSLIFTPSAVPKKFSVLGCGRLFVAVVGLTCGSSASLYLTPGILLVLHQALWVLVYRLIGDSSGKTEY